MDQTIRDIKDYIEACLLKDGRNPDRYDLDEWASNAKRFMDANGILTAEEIDDGIWTEMKDDSLA